MQQFSSLLSWPSFTAQHVSGVSPPIIRSSTTAVAASGFTKAKQEAATAVIELLMMGGETPETCWAVNERQDNKLENCWIRLVDLFELYDLQTLNLLQWILYQILCRQGQTNE